MTKGQIEAKIGEVVSKFEMEYMGRGPKKIRVIIVDDLIIIRLIRFLSQAERNLLDNNEGIELIKRHRTLLFERNLELFKKIINEVVPNTISSIHSDVSTVTGEKIIIVTFNEKLDV